MVAINTCGYKGCRNPVKEGDSRCYLHKSVDVNATDPLRASSLEEAEFIKSQWHSMKALSEIVSKRAPGILTMNQMQTGLLVSSSNLDYETASKVADASEIINRRRPELDIPAYVGQNLIGLVDEFSNDLVESGIDPRRISKLQMWGAGRDLGNGRKENSPEVGHLVLVVDRGQETETAVDVGISMFAPVPNPNANVADQIDTKYSPFGYAPLITPVATYTDENYLWFKNFKYLDS